MSYTREQLENWLKTINVNGSVLDIGGSQNPIKGRTKSWDVSDYKILDLKQPHKGNEPDIIGDINYPLLGDTDGYLDIYEQDDETKLDRTWGHQIQSRERFDNIFCIEVSEYIFDPIQALSNINAATKHGGLLYISFHFIYPQHPPKGLDYLRYTPAGVEKLLTEAGFEILEHKFRTTERSNLEAVWAAEQMRGWKEFDNKIIGSLIKARRK